MEVPRRMAMLGSLQKILCQMPGGVLSSHLLRVHVSSKSVQAWAGIGKLCVAPSAYDGICSPAMDFESYSVEDKIQWSAMCGVDWCVFL